MHADEPVRPTEDFDPDRILDVKAVTCIRALIGVTAVIASSKGRLQMAAQFRETDVVVTGLYPTETLPDHAIVHTHNWN